MIVLDANALVKLIVEERHSDLVRRIYKKELTLREKVVVPHLALSESLNTLWKYHTLRGELTNEKFEQAVDDLISIFSRLEKYQEQDVAKLASEISHKHKISVYDSIYVAISKLANAPLLTFDRNILDKAEELGVEIAAE